MTLIINIKFEHDIQANCCKVILLDDVFITVFVTNTKQTKGRAFSALL